MATARLLKFGLLAVVACAISAGCGNSGDPAAGAPPPDKAALENPPIPGGTPPGALTPGTPGGAQAPPTTMGLPGGKGKK